MDMFSYIESNLFCIAVLVVMLVALRTSLSRLTNQTILTHVFVMLICMLVLDTLKILLNGVVFAASISTFMSVASCSTLSMCCCISSGCDLSATICSSVSGVIVA